MSRALVVCAATTLLVQSGQATLTVTAVPDQCAKATAMELWRKSSEPIPHTSDQPQEEYFWGTPLLGRGSAVRVVFTRIEREPIGADCRWSFPKLPDGDYVARLVRPDGSGGSEKATVTERISRTINIPAPTVTLSGQLTLDGLPHGGEIRIRDRSWTGPSVSVPADNAGRYTVILDRPAEYAIAVRASPRAGGGQLAQLHEGANELDIPTYRAAGPLTLATLTAPEGALPNGCRIRSEVPSVSSVTPAPDGRVNVVASPASFSSNPWVGFDRRVIISLLWPAPVSDGPPPAGRETRMVENESLLHVREGYRAVYDSAEGTAVEVRAVRFDDVKHMPTAHEAPSQLDRNVRAQFAIDATFIQVAATRETDCSHAVEAYLRSLK